MTEAASDADTELASTRVTLGAYVLEERIGQGGMGTVYRARDERTGSLVAIKILKEKSPELVRRFVREARIAASLHHPNMVVVHDMLSAPGEPPAMVMELLVGESLAARIARSTRMSVEELAPIFISIAHAVRAAHASGIIHRDLKPHNVFLAREGDDVVVKVLDFGIAKLMAGSNEAASSAEQSEALTRTGELLGTPHYMAPELIFGERDIDPRADVWSLGVMLYEALSGERPFEGENAGQIFKAIALSPHVPLATRVPLVPPSVAALVERMLAHARVERLAELDELIRVLETFERGPSRRPPAAAVAAPQRKRTGARALLAGGALGALLIFALGRLWQAGATGAVPPPAPPAAVLTSTAREEPRAAPAVASASSVAPAQATSAPAAPVTAPRVATAPRPAAIAAPAIDASPAAAAAAAPSTAPAVRHRSGALNPDEL